MANTFQLIKLKKAINFTYLCIIIIIICPMYIKSIKQLLYLLDFIQFIE